MSGCLCGWTVRRGTGADCCLTGHHLHLQMAHRVVHPAQLHLLLQGICLFTPVRSASSVAKNQSRWSISSLTKQLKLQWHLLYWITLIFRCVITEVKCVARDAGCFSQVRKNSPEPQSTAAAEGLLWSFSWEAVKCKVLSAFSQMYSCNRLN